MLQRNFLLSLFPLLFTVGLGILIAVFYSQGRFVSWEPLGSPTNETIRFNAIRYAQEDAVTPILITTDTEGTHHIGSIKNCTELSSCWSQRENSTIIESWGDRAAGDLCTLHPNLNIQMPPQTVTCISSTDSASGSQLVRYAYFVQTADGDVFAWSFIPANGALIIFVASLFLGLIITGFVWSHTEQSVEEISA